MKTFLTAVLRHSPWPFRRPRASAVESPSISITAGSVAGLLAGLLTAVVFLIASALLPVRVALMIAILFGVVASLPRSTHTHWHQPIGPRSALALGLLVLAKLELMSEIEQDWIPVTLICSAGWARAAVLAARRDPLVSLPAASPAARTMAFAVGALPLAFFGLWPEPVFGLWVAALASLLLAATLKPRGWASPLATRWLALEVLYCLCVLILMSAASLGEMAEDEAAAS